MSDPAKILFVDDEKNVLRALERVFFDDDYEILSAGSADEALEILSNVSTVQVVVSDYRMPRMNGVELLRTVKASWPETVRVIVSGLCRYLRQSYRRSMTARSTALSRSPGTTPTSR